jgi:hypothetical protein
MYQKLFEKASVEKKHGDETRIIHRALSLFSLAYPIIARSVRVCDL